MSLQWGLRVYGFEGFGVLGEFGRAGGHEALERPPPPPGPPKIANKHALSQKREAIPRNRPKPQSKATQLQTFRLRANLN